MHTPTPILDQLIYEARTGGIRTAGRHRPRQCGDELSTNPGEVHTCARAVNHPDAHTNHAGTITW